MKTFINITHIEKFRFTNSLITGGVNMKNWIVYFGLVLIAGFGVSFLIRLIRDGDFYIAEFTVTTIGIIILLTGIFAKKNIKTNDTLLK